MTVKGKGGKPAFDYDVNINYKLAEEICLTVSSSTDSYAKILAKNPHFPSADTLNRWRVLDDKFGVMYTQAKYQQANLMAEEIAQIADDTSNDTILDKDGNEVCNKEWIARSRLRVDTRKWIACKLVPRLYGDRSVVENHNYNHEQSIKELE